jgi:hypothetical protein
VARWPGYTVRRRAGRGSRAKKNLGGLRALFALGHDVLHPLVFLQRAKAFALNLGEVGKQVSATVIRLDEAETFGVVEPLDGTLRHGRSLR